MARSLLIGVLFVTSALGSIQSSTHEIHERREVLSPRWTKRDRVAPHMVLPMRVGLVQSTDWDQIETDLMTVADPSSVKYAQYWSPEDIIRRFQPADDTVDAVHAWLTDAGIAAERITHSDNKAWLAFHATTDEAEALLHTHFHEYEDSVTGRKMPACDEYWLPKHVRKQIDYITPGIKLIAMESGLKNMKLRKRSAAALDTSWQPDTRPTHRDTDASQVGASTSLLPSNLQHCDQYVTPECIAALYQIPAVANTSQPCASNSLGIFEAEAQYYAQSDLDRFFARFAPHVPNGTHPKYYSIDGAPGPITNASKDGGEVMLDLDIAYPIVYPQTISIYQEDDDFYEEQANQTYTYGFNTWLDAIDGSYCNFSAYGETGNSPIDPQYPDPNPGGYKGKLQCGVYEPTNVISISYGGQEADAPASYQKRQCLEYAKLGLQGISVIFASGDSGVGNYPPPDGYENPKTGCIGRDGLQFSPVWPTNCPFVTSVGMTKILPGKTVHDPESAVDDAHGGPLHTNFSSGGGFSNIYPSPKYQQKAVSKFFKDYDPQYKYYSAVANKSSEIPGLSKDGGLYNRIGRGYPDVAANGDNTVVYKGTKRVLEGGTSAAAPIFASIINRINEERIRSGKKPVGFLNPTLYANPQVLNDITDGSNPGCWSAGFNAVPGWDPVTGLGTPNFPKMLDLFMSLP